MRKRKTDPAAKFAYLPDGQKVKIEEIDGDWAIVRRVGGPLNRHRAVCALTSLRYP
jgi:hypothetical protein